MPENILNIYKLEKYFTNYKNVLWVMDTRDSIVTSLDQVYVP